MSMIMSDQLRAFLDQHTADLRAEFDAQMAKKQEELEYYKSLAVMQANPRGLGMTSPSMGPTEMEIKVEKAQSEIVKPGDIVFETVAERRIYQIERIAGLLGDPKPEDHMAYLRETAAKFHIEGDCDDQIRDLLATN